MMALIDWQLQLPSRNLTLGPNTPYTILRQPSGPTGFIGTTSIRTHDLELHTQHGDVLGRDVKAGRLLTIPIGIQGVGLTDAARQADARQKLSTLTQAWSTVNGSDFVDANTVLPGWGFGSPSLAYPFQLSFTGEIPLVAHFPGQPEADLVYFGRPRSVTEGEWQWTFGRLTVLLTFQCSDPFAYGKVRDSGLHNAGTPWTLTAAAQGSHLGTYTNRAWVQVQGWTTAGPALHKPTIYNHTDNEQSIVFATAIGTLSYFQADLRAFTLVDSGINDHTDYIDPTSPWFVLLGGVDNSLEVDLATDMEVFWMPAYE